MNRFILVLLLLTSLLNANELTKEKLFRLIKKTSPKHEILSSRFCQIKRTQQFNWNKKYTFYKIVAIIYIDHPSYFYLAYDGRETALFFNYDGTDTPIKNFLTVLREEKIKINKKRFKNFFELFSGKGEILRPLDSFSKIKSKNFNKADYNNFAFKYTETESHHNLSFYHARLDLYSTWLYQTEIKLSKDNKTYNFNNKLLKQFPLNE